MTDRSKHENQREYARVLPEPVGGFPGRLEHGSLRHLTYLKEMGDQLYSSWKAGTAPTCPKHKVFNDKCDDCTRLAIAESRSRWPVLTIVHKNRRDETFVFSCPHGTSMTYTQTNNAEAIITAGRMAIKQHHAERGCDCQLVSAEDYWINLSDTQAQFAADLAIPLEQKEPPYNTPEAQARHQELAAQIMALGCDGCAPGVAIELLEVEGPQEPKIVHAKGCLRAKVGIFLDAIDATWADHEHEVLVVIDGRRRLDGEEIARVRVRDALEPLSPPGRARVIDALSGRVDA